jgi:ATP-binding protein involved in chromosome partitioning
MAAQKVVVVASGKGGVGKTTVAVGLALALARQGQAVGLLDADLYGPDVPRMLGLTRTTDAKSLTVSGQSKKGQTPRPVERYGIKVWSSQFLISEGQPLALQAPLAGLLLNRAVRDVDWGDLAWLVVDLPPGTADVQQHLVSELVLGGGGAVLVVTPQDVAHLDAKKVLTMLAQAEVPVLGGVQNMAAFACPGCGTAIELFPPTPSERSIWAAGVRQLGAIPFTAQLAQAAAEGRPLTDADYAGNFDALTAAVIAALPPSAR